jgi:hypothetical protein
MIGLESIGKIHPSVVLPDGSICTGKADACSETYVDRPCGCTDVYYDCGLVDHEHDHVVCDDQPV